MRILITGADGYLGARLCSYYGDKYDISGLGHTELDVTARSMVEDAVTRINPDLVIHCAAVSDVGSCSANPKLSRDINVNGAEYVAEATGRCRIKLVFCSSDQVYFKSRIRTPHLEEEQVEPPHQYGRQKLEAEALVMRNNPGAVCLRLSMMYALDYAGKREHSNFIRVIIDAIRGKKPMSYAVHDFRSITDVWDVVRAIGKAAGLPGGVYNFGSENSLSTYQVVKNIVDGCGAESLLSPDEDSFADEPRNLTMDVGKIAAHGIELPNTMDGFYRNMETIKSHISI